MYVIFVYEEKCPHTHTQHTYWYVRQWTIGTLNFQFTYYHSCTLNPVLLELLNVVSYC
jgi:hypothetical protein